MFAFGDGDAVDCEVIDGLNAPVDSVDAVVDGVNHAVDGVGATISLLMVLLLMLLLLMLFVVSVSLLPNPLGTKGVLMYALPSSAIIRFGSTFAMRSSFCRFNIDFSSRVIETPFIVLEYTEPMAS